MITSLEYITKFIFTFYSSYNSIFNYILSKLILAIYTNNFIYHLFSITLSNNNCFHILLLAMAIINDANNNIYFPIDTINILKFMKMIL